MERTVTSGKILVLVSVIVLMAGCAAPFTNARAVSMQDVMYLTKHNLGSEVIIKHLKATNSRFSLTTEDIVLLKDAGVDEEVIGYMVDLGAPRRPFEEEYSDSMFPAYSFTFQPPLIYYPFSGSYTISNGVSGYSESMRFSSPSVRRDGLIGRFYDDSQPSFKQSYENRRGILQQDNTIERAEPQDDVEESDE